MQLSIRLNRLKHEVKEEKVRGFRSCQRDARPFVPSSPFQRCRRPLSPLPLSPTCLHGAGEMRVSFSFAYCVAVCVAGRVVVSESRCCSIILRCSPFLRFLTFSFLFLLLSFSISFIGGQVRAKKTLGGGDSLSSIGGSGVPVMSPKAKLPPVEAKRQQQTEDILNSILPPREWSETGQLWVQSVSSTPATRLDVVNLQELLDTKLQQRQARETGICPVRRELYSQAFDELIRQVTINCAERGLLLLRVRDEIRMTIAAYQTLYESSIAFGMRKALQAEQGKADMRNRIEELEQDKTELEKTVSRLKAKCEDIERLGVEEREKEQRRHREAFETLKGKTDQLQAQLDNILAPKNN